MFFYSGERKMPVKVKVRGGKFCVIEVQGGKTRKCYPDKESAQSYATVLNLAHKGLLRSQKNKK
jgi:hypothetical protein